MELKDFNFVSNINETVDWFLMSSYNYYLKDVSMMSDYTFDRLCRFMLDNWEGIEHPLKNLLSQDALRSGSGFYLKEKDYPEYIKERAAQLGGWS